MLSVIASELTAIEQKSGSSSKAGQNISEDSKNSSVTQNEDSVPQEGVPTLGASAFGAPTPPNSPAPAESDKNSKPRIFGDSQ